jgi:hypothetical protein
MTGYQAVLTSTGDPDGDPGGLIRTRANHALDCVNESWARKVNRSETVRNGLRQCGWDPKTEVEYAVDWAMSGEDANGEPARITSLKQFDPDASYEWWGPDDQFVTDQDPRGFAKLVDEMVKDTVPPGDPRVVFDTEVTNINYGACDSGSPGPIVVTTRDGRVYTANHEVISTLPLGVLMKNHSTLFDPPLPRKQVELLSPAGRFRMGNLTHVVVQFPVVWWDNGLVKWLSANKGSNTSAAGGPDGSGANAAGEFSLWHNLNHAGFLPGSHTLLTFLGDPQSSVYEGMPDAAVQAALVARLKAQHPKLTIPEPSAFFISRHGYDRNSYGAYSFALVGWNGNDHGTLQAPLRACETDTVRVRLAGEAMCDDLNGYTHGALQSGREAAAHYLHHYDGAPKPSEVPGLLLCDL